MLLRVSLHATALCRHAVWMWRHTMHEWVINIHYQILITQGRFINIIRTPSKQWGVCDDWYALLKSGVITMEMLQSCNKPWFSHRYMIPITKDQSAIEASLCYPSLSSYLSLNNKNMAVDYKQNFQTHFLKWKFCILTKHISENCFVSSHWQFHRWMATNPLFFRPALMTSPNTFDLAESRRLISQLSGKPIDSKTKYTLCADLEHSFSG